MNHLIHCRCGEVIVKSNNNVSKLRAKIVLFKDEGAVAVCKSCNAEVAVPIVLDNALLKSMATQDTIPLYIRKSS